MKNRFRQYWIAIGLSIPALVACSRTVAEDAARFIPEAMAPRDYPTANGSLGSSGDAAVRPAGAACGQKFNPLPWGTDCGCMSSECPSLCCPLPEYPSPWLFARFRGIALMRDGGRTIPFASLGELIPGGTTDIVLSSNDVEFPFQGGGEVTAGWAIVPTYYLEFTYFELTTWNESAAYRDMTANSVGGNGTLFSPFGDFGATPLEQFDYNNYAYVRYRSNLNDYELNLRHELIAPPSGLRASVLFGGRAMRIYEALEYETMSDIPALGGTSNEISTSTRNRLLGAQIGGLFEFHVDPHWWVNFEMKGGICQNKIGLDSVYTGASGAGGSATYRHRRDDSNTSFVGELVLSFLYEYNEHLTCEVGYRALWITGLALATENLETNPGLLVLGPLNINDKSDEVYHGPHAGLTFRY